MFSVVTVVLNGAAEIERTIRSVLGQSIREYEFLVVDGGSTDGTLDVIRSYNDRIDYWCSEPDAGISDAFNKGIEASHGMLIGLLNAGDWYEPDTLSLVAKSYSAFPTADVFCGGIEFWKKNASVVYCQSDPRFLSIETSVYHPTVFIKKDVYKRSGGYDKSYRLAMDYELLLRFKQEGAVFHSIKRKLTNMELDGVSSRNWYSGLVEVRRARSRYFTAPNILYYHSIAVAKNLLGNLIKGIRLQSLYRAYWQMRNKGRLGDESRVQQ